MRIISLIHTSEPRTGGQRYNVHLEKCLQEHVEVECVREPYERYAWWAKPLAPLLELWQVRGLGKEDVVLLGDAMYKYHWWLQWWCRHIKKARTMVMVHHFAYLEQSGLGRWWMERRVDGYLREADWILVPSVYTEELAAKKFGDKVVYLPLPFSVSYEASEMYTAGRLLFVGNIERRKGLHLLPGVMERLQKYVELHIVGTVQDGRYYEALRQAFAQVDVDERVVWHGKVEKEELVRMYREAEVFVFPSQLEGFGIVLVEAMSYGVPIVAFNNSAMPYTIVHGRNGLLVPNEDTDQMAAMIQGLLGNVEMRKGLQVGMRETLQCLKGEQDLRQSVRRFVEQLKRKI